MLTEIRSFDIRPVDHSPNLGISARHGSCTGRPRLAEGKYLHRVKPERGREVLGKKPSERSVKVHGGSGSGRCRRKSRRRVAIQGARRSLFPRSAIGTRGQTANNDHRCQQQHPDSAKGCDIHAILPDGRGPNAVLLNLHEGFNGDNGLPPGGCRRAPPADVIGEGRPKNPGVANQLTPHACLDTHRTSEPTTPGTVWALSADPKPKLFTALNLRPSSSKRSLCARSPHACGDHARYIEILEDNTGTWRAPETLWMRAHRTLLEPVSIPPNTRGSVTGVEQDLCAATSNPGHLTRVG
jgi:hypothetical protein